MKKALPYVLIFLLFVGLETYLRMDSQNKIQKLREERDNLIGHMVDAHALQGGDIAKAQTIDSLQNIIDSLHAENYPCQIELNRYYTAYQIFIRRNPKAAKQYGDIISNETE